MARVLGECGRYVSNQAIAKRQKWWLLNAVAIAATSVGVGLVLGRLLLPAALPTSVSISVMLSFLIGMLWLFKVFNARMNSLDTESKAMQRGTVGEIGVGRILQKLPDSFYVINDLSTPFGNLDHVVIGPTGVFILDTKNWRGVVSADGKGELLLNGKPTDKPCIRQFMARMMNIRDKVNQLASGIDTFHEGLFVFTSARVEAAWGATSKVNCIRDDQLHEYMVQKSFGRKLNNLHSERLAQAFLAIAHMDKGFGQAPGTLPHAPPCDRPY